MREQPDAGAIARREEAPARRGGLHGARDRIRNNPLGRQVYRWGIGLVGLGVVVLGAVLIPFPGPGWLIVFLGIGIWATEFHWAKRLLAFGRRHLDRWVAWLGRQGWTVRGLVAIGCWLVILAMFWLLFRFAGVPGWLPDIAENALHRHAGL